jgi:general secretion pathway protein E
LHTNDAAGAVTRLVEMGVQPFHISSSLMAVLAQRLVRKLCPKCRAPYFPSDEDLRSLGIDATAFTPSRPSRPPEMRHDLDPDEILSSEMLIEDETTVAGAAHGGGTSRRPVFYRPRGCEACAQTGYRGRIGIYELLVINDAVRKEILNNGDSNSITRAGMQNGMRSLRQDGARQVAHGVTSVEEVLAATQAGELE